VRPLSPPHGSFIEAERVLALSAKQGLSAAAEDAHRRANRGCRVWRLRIAAESSTGSAPDNLPECQADSRPDARSQAVGVLRLAG
jgi:hypothetical protein